MKRFSRILALLLLLAVALTLFASCKPRGEFFGPLGDSYRFSGSSYRHSDSSGTVTKGSYRIEGDFITFTPEGSDASFSLPYRKNSAKSLTIGEVTYKK
ncbi:MAG: hypothetical protein IKT72_06590 [Clostridia bacterium]|nr:hypothetical protein [Clostridia bacterium]